MKRLLILILALSTIFGILGCRRREEPKEEKIKITVEHKTPPGRGWLLDAPAPFVEGFNLQMAGRDREAIEKFEEVIRLAPEKAWPMKEQWIISSYHCIGYGKMRLMEYEEALTSLNEVMKRNPNWMFASSTLYTIGQCYEKMGRKDDARQAFQRIIDEYPNTHCIWAKQRPIAPFAQRRLEQLKSIP